jgi:hypothetical protein
LNLLNDVSKVDSAEKMLFAVLDSDLDYFYSSYNVIKKITPKYCFKPVKPASESKCHKASDDYSIDKKTKKALLVGAGILGAGVCIGCLINAYSDSKNK